MCTSTVTRDKSEALYSCQKRWIVNFLMQVQNTINLKNSAFFKWQCVCNLFFYKKRLCWHLISFLGILPCGYKIMDDVWRMLNHFNQFNILLNTLLQIIMDIIHSVGYVVDVILREWPVTIGKWAAKILFLSFKSQALSQIFHRKVLKDVIKHMTWTYKYEWARSPFLIRHKRNSPKKLHGTEFHTDVQEIIKDIVLRWCVLHTVFDILSKNRY